MCFCVRVHARACSMPSKGRLVSIARMRAAWFSIKIHTSPLFSLPGTPIHLSSASCMASSTACPLNQLTGPGPLSLLPLPLLPRGSQPRPSHSHAQREAAPWLILGRLTPEQECRWDLTERPRLVALMTSWKLPLPSVDGHALSLCQAFGPRFLILSSSPGPTRASSISAPLTSGAG